MGRAVWSRWAIRSVNSRSNECDTPIERIDILDDAGFIRPFASESSFEF
jgi:hypothetical protein